MTRDFGSHDRLARETAVRDALPTVGEAVVVVSEDTPLREVALLAEGNPAVRVLAVAGASGRLTGIVRIPALCDDLFVSVAPEEFIAEILRPGRLEEYGRFARSKTAGELMEPAVSVTLGDRLATAFRMLHEHGLEGLPVVDEAGRPVGYLDRLRLIAVWLRTHPIEST